MRGKRGLGMGQFFVIIVLLLLLFAGIYLMLSFNQQAVGYDEYFYSFTNDTATSLQFYPNMRYQSSVVSYSIAEDCTFAKEQSALSAFDRISAGSSIEFDRINSDSDIEILCSNIAPKPENEDHFVAGEGGPSEIINSTAYSVILKGEVSLFRAEKCGVENPQIATHEILHALGFDHTNDPESVMYPVSDCFQEIEDSVFVEIDKLYSVPTRTDLAIESISASRQSRLLSFNITIGNFGLIDSEESKLVIYADDRSIREFALEGIKLGVRKIISVENLRVSAGADRISFAVETQEAEISKSNNAVEIVPEEER